MSSLRRVVFYIVLRCVVSMLVGAAPGVGIALVWQAKPGIAVAIIGTFLGFLRAFTPTAVGLYYAFVFANRDINGVEKNAHNSQGEPAQTPLDRWLFGKDGEEPRGGLVSVGMILGGLFGVMTNLVDAIMVGVSGTGFLELTIGGEELSANPVVGTVFLILWGGALFGSFASATYRWPLVLGIPIAALLGFCIGLVAADQDTSTLTFVVAFSTSAIPFALLLSYAIGDMNRRVMINHSEPYSDRPEENRSGREPLN